MTDFRADLGKVLEGQDGQEVVATLKTLVRAEGKQRVECAGCGRIEFVPVMDAKVVLDTLKWITDQTQGKPEPAVQASVAHGKVLGEMSADELHAASALTERDWEAFRTWLNAREPLTPATA